MERSRALKWHTKKKRPQKSPVQGRMSALTLREPWSTGRRRTIAIDQTRAQPDKAAVPTALAVLDRFLAEAGDEPAYARDTARPTRAAPCVFR